CSTAHSSIAGAFNQNPAHGIGDCRCAICIGTDVVALYVNGTGAAQVIDPPIRIAGNEVAGPGCGAANGGVIGIDDDYTIHVIRDGSATGRIGADVIALHDIVV